MSFTTKKVTISAYTAIENYEGGVGIYLNEAGRPFFVIDIPHRKILLNKSRMPKTSWRIVFKAIAAFAEVNALELNLSELSQEQWQYEPLGLPKEMYYDYRKPAQPYVNEYGSIQYTEPWSCKKPKIDNVWATELDRYVVENLGACYEIKKVIRGKNLNFDSLFAQTSPVAQ